MRPDGRDAEALIVLGKRPDADFIAFSDRVEQLVVGPWPTQAEIDAVDLSPAAIATREDAKEPLLADLKAQADAGIAAIDAYLVNADSATAAQVRAEVKAIDQRQKRVIRALVRVIERTRR